jgi:hypothetical protein
MTLSMEPPPVDTVATISCGLPHTPHEIGSRDGKRYRLEECSCFVHIGWLE